MNFNKLFDCALLTSSMLMAICMGAGCSMKSEIDNARSVNSASMEQKPTIRVSPGDSLKDVQNRVRKLLKKNPGKSIIVELSKGMYELTEPLYFGEEDSGTEKAPVIYRSAPGANVILTGGKEIHGLKPLADPVLLSRLPEESRGKVLEADLNIPGIENLGEITTRGFGVGMDKVWEAELCYDSKPMTLSRWPKQGFKGALSSEGEGKVVLDLGGRSKRWKDEQDLWIMAYWMYDWAEIFEPIVGWGEKTDEIIRDATIKPKYGLAASNTRCYIANLFCEISEPGDYVIDRKNYKLYFIPPYEGGTAVIPIAESLMVFNNTHHIHFEGITMEFTRDTIVKMDNVHHMQLTGCVLRNSGKAGLIGNGSDNIVYGCDVYNIGTSGIELSGGDRITLTPGNNILENNHVHHFSRRVRTVQCGIFTSGCGNVISHNLIHHAPSMCLSAEGNNHIVEYNEIHNVVKETGDGGAFYLGKEWTWQGSILRYNYFHNIKADSSIGGIAVYLDDQFSGLTVYGNLFEKCNWAVLIGGGNDNIIDNNVFINCGKCVLLDNRGMVWQGSQSQNPVLLERFNAMPVDSPVWKKAYPVLSGYLEESPEVPKRNVIRRNVCAGGSWENLCQGVLNLQTIEKNLVHEDDSNWVHLEKNELLQPAKLVFKDEAAVQDIGLDAIPVEKMGLYYDSRRASWPVVRTIDPVSVP